MISVMAGRDKLSCLNEIDPGMKKSSNELQNTPYFEDYAKENRLATQGYSLVVRRWQI